MEQPKNNLKVVSNKKNARVILPNMLTLIGVCIGLTSIKFTATQYALFSSIMLFLPKLIAGYSGAWVDVMGYSNYFILTALLGMPVLFLIYWISIIAPVKDK